MSAFVWYAGAAETQQNSAAILTVDTGVYTITGAAAGLQRQLKMTATADAFTFTGNAANLMYGKSLSVTTGVFTCTGNSALRQISRVAATGTYTMTGNAATLVPPNGVMQAITGVYAFTGNAVSLNGPPRPGGSGGLSLSMGLSIT